MDFTRPERCQRQRTGREDRRSKFYEISDNLGTSAQALYASERLSNKQLRQSPLD